MKEKTSFVRKSNLTGEMYDYFSTVKIGNIKQAVAYMDNGLFPLDIRVGKNENEERLIYFYFNKSDSKELFDKWCKYEL